MSLIDRLGGYEAAKLEGEEWGFDEFLLRKLLEYRREHKLYEVGDYVILNVGSRVYKIDHIYKKSVWLDSGKESLDIVNIDDISGHATNAEIKAGRRL